MSLNLLQKIADFIRDNHLTNYAPTEDGKLNQGIETVLINLEKLVFGDTKIQKAAKKRIEQDYKIRFETQETGIILKKAA